MPMGEIDPVFIQAPEHRPKLSVKEAEGIPVIDMSPLLSSDDDSIISNTDPLAIQELVRQVGSACKEWGFFQVINHGAPLESKQRIESVGKKFFTQSLEEKKKVRRDTVKVMGYYESEHTKNVRDWKEVFDFTVEEPTLIPASIDPDDKEITQWYNHWPEYPPEMSQIKLVQGSVPRFHAYSALVSSIKSLLQRPWQVTLRHALREGNVPADFMAKLGAVMSVVGNVVYTAPPAGLASLLLADSLGVPHLRP